MTAFLLVIIALVAGLVAWGLVWSWKEHQLMLEWAKRRDVRGRKRVFMDYGNSIDDPVHSDGFIDCGTMMPPIYIRPTKDFKPRIRRIIPDLWVCADAKAAGYGDTPRAAFSVYAKRLADNPTGEWRDIEVKA